MTLTAETVSDMVQDTPKINGTVEHSEIPLNTLYNDEEIEDTQKLKTPMGSAVSNVTEKSKDDEKNAKSTEFAEVLNKSANLVQNIKEPLNSTDSVETQCTKITCISTESNSKTEDTEQMNKQEPFKSSYIPSELDGLVELKETINVSIDSDSDIKLDLSICNVSLTYSEECNESGDRTNYARELDAENVLSKISVENAKDTNQVSDAVEKLSSSIECKTQSGDHGMLEKCIEPEKPIEIEKNFSKVVNRVAEKIKSVESSKSSSDILDKLIENASESTWSLEINENETESDSIEESTDTLDISSKSINKQLEITEHVSFNSPLNVSTEQSPGKSRYGRTRKPKFVDPDFVSTDRRVSCVLNSSSYEHPPRVNDENNSDKSPIRKRNRKKFVAQQVSKNKYKTILERINYGSRLGEPESDEADIECNWNIGDIAWARVGSYPYWPCIISLDPECSIYKKYVATGKRFSWMVHVAFFEDNGRHTWLVTGSLVRLESKEQFFEWKKSIKDKIRLKNFMISKRAQNNWNKAVEKATNLIKLPLNERIKSCPDIPETILKLPSAATTSNIANSYINPSKTHCSFYPKSMTDNTNKERKLCKNELTVEDDDIEEGTSFINLNHPFLLNENVLDKPLPSETVTMRMTQESDGVLENPIASKPYIKSINAIPSEKTKAKKHKRFQPFGEKIKRRRTRKGIAVLTTHINKPLLTDNNNKLPFQNQSTENVLSKKTGSSNKLKQSKLILGKHVTLKSDSNKKDQSSVEECNQIVTRIKSGVVTCDKKYQTIVKESDQIVTRIKKGVVTEKKIKKSPKSQKIMRSRSKINGNKERNLTKTIYKFKLGDKFIEDNKMDSTQNSDLSVYDFSLDNEEDDTIDSPSTCYLDQNQQSGVKRKNDGLEQPARKKRKIHKFGPDFQAFSSRSVECVASEHPELNDEEVEKHVEKLWLQMSDLQRCKYRTRRTAVKENSSDESSECEEIKTENRSEIDDSIMQDEVQRSHSSSPIALPISKAKKSTNLFAGVKCEKVCLICEKPGDTLRCRGPCSGNYHLTCVYPKPIEQEEIEPPKRTPKRGEWRGRRRKSSIPTPELTPNKILLINKPETKVVENSSSGTKDLAESYESSTNKVTKLETETDFNKVDNVGETDLEKEIIEDAAAVKNVNEVSIDEESVKRELDTSIAMSPSIPCSISNGNVDEYFRCNTCSKGLIQSCFACGLEIETKTGSSERFRCYVGSCGKLYHKECLKSWPQATWSAGKARVLSSATKETNTALMCPQHHCHTCISDNPTVLKSRVSSERLVRCIRCPTSYHSKTHCVPAGSEILTMSQIICPRHYKPKNKMKADHFNASWCFICASGGSLICCDLCPTSFHAECLNLKPEDVEGGYVCEDCQTGRFPVYGEVIWVKLGHYRWWPAQIIYPSHIPDNIQRLPHVLGEFAVLFFGSHDYNWVNRGRVFLYQEGDSGKGSYKKSAVDIVFSQALIEAEEAHRKIKLEKLAREEESKEGLKPPRYIKIKTNKPVGNVRIIELNTSNMTACDCNPKSKNPCAPDSDCLNRMLMVECNPAVCPAGEKCNNQCFEKRIYPPLIPYKTPSRGWGLKTLVDIKKGDFVIEYVGEMIDEEEYRRRLNLMHRTREENYYFLTIDKDRMLDAGPKGNVSRFMNHSCDPNCETQKWTVNGDTRVGLFAFKDIAANSELVFNYNLDSDGAEKKPCMCGSKKCSGFIGVKVTKNGNNGDCDNEEQQKKSASARRVKKRKERKSKSIVRQYDEECFICGDGGEIMICDHNACPKSYHLACIKKTKYPKGKWLCPRHFCKICKSNRKITKCSLCVDTYCEDHVEGNIFSDAKRGFICKKHQDSSNIMTRKLLVNTESTSQIIGDDTHTPIKRRGRKRKLQPDDVAVAMTTDTSMREVATPNNTTLNEEDTLDNSDFSTDVSKGGGNSGQYNPNVLSVTEIQVVNPECEHLNGDSLIRLSKHSMKSRSDVRKITDSNCKEKKIILISDKQDDSSSYQQQIGIVTADTIANKNKLEQVVYQNDKKDCNKETVDNTAIKYKSPSTKQDVTSNEPKPEKNGKLLNGFTPKEEMERKVNAPKSIKDKQPLNKLKRKDLILGINFDEPNLQVNRNVENGQNSGKKVFQYYNRRKLKAATAIIDKKIIEPVGNFQEENLSASKSANNESSNLFDQKLESLTDFQLPSLANKLESNGSSNLFDQKLDSLTDSQLPSLANKLESNGSSNLFDQKLESLTDFQLPSLANKLECNGSSNSSDEKPESLTYFQLPSLANKSEYNESSNSFDKKPESLTNFYLKNVNSYRENKEE